MSSTQSIFALEAHGVGFSDIRSCRRSYAAVVVAIVGSDIAGAFSEAEELGFDIACGIPMLAGASMQPSADIPGP